MDADPVYLAPQDYAIVWPVLGGFILLGLLVWAMWVWMLTRPPEEEDGAAPMPPAAVAKLRQEALASIDAVERSVREGESTARRGHHDLSRLVRGFVSETSGLEADTMVAADLRRHGPRHLAALIEDYYPRQFGVAETDGPGITRSAAAARRVVRGWMA